MRLQPGELERERAHNRIRFGSAALKISNRDLWQAGLVWGGDPTLMGAHKPSAKRIRNTDRIPEWREQQAVIQWWASYSRTAGLDERLLMAIPNGSFLRGGPQERMLQLVILRKTGTRPGAPDLFLAVPRPPYAGFFPEMKAVDGRTSVDQDEFGVLLKQQGYQTAVCYGADEGIAKIKAYLG